MTTCTASGSVEGLARDDGPDRVRGRTVVFLHAHPDDEAIFTGVTMRRLANRGARIVLITATCGEEGGMRQPLLFGETTASRRMAELERACDVLGVARLVPLGYRDSGMPGAASNHHQAAFALADPQQAGRRLVRLLEHEQIEALVHYDSDGIYRHPDHLRVHEAGIVAAATMRVPTYETTMSRTCLAVYPGHLLAKDKPDGWLRTAGRQPSGIPLSIRASREEWLAKREAMAEHCSQIGPQSLDKNFPQTYGTEWFLRSSPGLLDQL